jgi:predicted DNA-binding protein with PD1-like motif
MIVTESRRVRHLVVRLQRDDELPGALQRALDEVEAKAAWVTGIGTVESVELAVVDPLGGGPRVRQIEGRCNVLALSGNVAVRGGAGSIRLAATLARETDLGHELCGGEVTRARAHALELHVTVFDDAPLARVEDPTSSSWTLVAGSTRALASPPAAEPPLATRPEPAPRAPEPAARAPEPAPRVVEPPARAPEPPPRAPEPPPRAAEPPRAPEPAPRATEPPRVEAAPPKHEHRAPASPTEAHTPPAPLRRRTRDDSQDIYPEVGDRATHFHFGECTIIASDGERIRLRQERDGRVREVSLEMLKIEPPTVDATTGQRSFVLARKH